MCLGGGQPDYSQRPNIQKYNPPPGPASPPDMVNDMEIKKVREGTKTFGAIDPKTLPNTPQGGISTP